MLSLFSRPKHLLDEEIIAWIFNCYKWCFTEFDKTVFDNETVLVIPDNHHFPGKETTANGMANLIFDQVKAYAGMSHWPTKLYNVETTSHIPPNQPISINGALRGKNIKAASQPEMQQTALQSDAMPISSMPISSMPISSMPISSMPITSIPSGSLPMNSMPQVAHSIVFRFHPQQLRSPSGIIAHFAHGLSQNLAGTAKSLPPGGAEYLPMAGELTGIFMGFGIMFANSAVVERAGGCGGCGGGQSPVREVLLSEEEATYALAVFCHLKSIKPRQVSPHLKKHLRQFYKNAMKDCEDRMANNTALKLTN